MCITSAAIPMNIGIFFELRKNAKGVPRKFPQCEKYKTRNPLQMQGLRVFVVVWCGKYALFFPQNVLSNGACGFLRELCRIRQTRCSFFLFLKNSNHIYACYAGKYEHSGHNLQRQDFFIQNDGTGNQSDHCRKACKC